MSARDPFPNRFCRGCGCTEQLACVVGVVDGKPVGCSWVLLDVDAPSGICSPCAFRLDWDPVELAAFCQFDGPAIPGLLVAS